jgi:YVTN family beta-propeller protein
MDEYGGRSGADAGGKVILKLSSVALVVLIVLGLSAANSPDAHPRYLSPVDLSTSPDGSRLYVACEGSDQLLVVDIGKQAIAGHVTVGRVPKGLTVSADGARVYVTNSWSDTVSEVDARALKVTRTMPVGYEPIGIAVDAAGKYVYTANRLSNDISVIDLATGTDVRRLSGGRGTSFLAMSTDGRRLLATHIYPNFGKFRTRPHSEVTEVDAEHQIVKSRIDLENVAGVFHVAMSIDNRLGIAMAMRPKNLVPLAHVEHGWAFGSSAVLFGDDVGRAVQVPLDELERYFSQPWGVAISPDKKFAYVSASGVDEVAFLDLDAMVKWARTPGAEKRVNDLSASAAYVLGRVKVGANPKAVALSPDGAWLYVANRLDDTISVVDTKHRTVVATINLGGPDTTTPQRRGERLFNTAKFSFHSQFGCANCHIDATFDGLPWDLEPDGFGVDIVDNRLLEDVGETPPFKWNAGNPDLETECGPRTEKFFFRSQSFSKEELADLVSYIKNIPLRPNRFRLPNDELTAAQERGKVIFERTTRKNGKPIAEALQCPTCHAGYYFTNQQLTDIGSKRWNDRSQWVDVPQLLNVATSAPYMHDGAANTLEEIWTVYNPNDTHGVTNDLAKDELNDLIEYLKTL